MKILKSYRLNEKTLIKLNLLANQLDISTAHILEQAIEEFYSKATQQYILLPLEEYNNLLNKMQKLHQNTIELNNEILTLREKIRQLEYQKTKLEFQLEQCKDKK